MVMISKGNETKVTTMATRAVLNPDGLGMLGAPEGSSEDDAPRKMIMMLKDKVCEMM